MDLVDLKVFKCMVDEGGVTNAARKLHRVPSGITTRIQQLETSLDVTLFYRERQRLHLSPAGQLLLAYAERLIQLSDEARAIVAGRAPQGSLKLGALESTTASRLPRILAEFHRCYPDVRLELTTGTNDDLMNKVADRRLDAAFAAEPPVAQGLEHTPVFRERLVLISSLDHPPIKRSRDVRDASLIAFPEGCAYRRVLQRWLGRERLTTRRVLELNSYHAIVACVSSGTGIALVPESVLDTMVEASVRRHAIPNAQACITTPFVWRQGEVLPSVLALRTLIASSLKENFSARGAKTKKSAGNHAGLTHRDAAT